VTLAVAALVVLLGGAEAGGVTAAPADRAEQAAREVLDRRYQRELPLTPLERRVERPRDGDTPRGAPRRERRQRQRDPEQQQVAGPVAMAMRMLVYGVIAVAVVMILMWLVRDLKRGSEPGALAGDEVPEPEVDQGVLQRPIGDADELARAGRYAEAIHTLLLRTLIELVRATRTRVPAALTSREILARVPLVPAARAALDALVAAVEVTHFGDEVPGPADYERCRGEFQRFADAYRGAA
jgi:hypothetical protein